MTKILSGKEVAAALKDKLTAEVDELKKQGKVPGLCIVMVGDRPDSASYIKGAVKRCTSIGIDCQVETFPEDISQEKFLEALDRLNQDSKINGVIIMR
ncbi:MAG: tetrahydrofolate dehydrogenase/cyclohydrolase catalytic domain-containing protein, partial [Tepidanaerobacteraceae bacterium]